MAISQAKREANAANAARSTGPRTAEGKAISRRNGLKHGLTGQGIVLRDEDSAEVERRTMAMQEELRVETETGRLLARQAAVFSLRVEQCVVHDTASMSRRIRKACDEFDDDRRDEADELFAALAEKPAACLRRLGRTPEGVERLIEAWTALRDDMDHDRWTRSHGERVARLKGHRPDDCHASTFLEYSEAIQGHWDPAGFAQPALVSPAGRVAWAREQMRQAIDAERESLEGRLATFDPEEVEQRRAEAGACAYFDPSPEATLFRKYEAAAVRGMQQALKELRKVEAEAASDQHVAADPTAQPASAPVAPLGSSSPRPRPAPPVDLFDAILADPYSPISKEELEQGLRETSRAKDGGDGLAAQPMG